MNRSTRNSVAAVCLALLFGGFACASLSAQSARAESLGRQLDAFRYGVPLDDVWQQARLLLAERGYPLADADARAAGQPSMSLPVRIFSPARETSTVERKHVALIHNSSEQTSVATPQSLDTGWDVYWRRYHVEALVDRDSAAADGCRVIFTRLEQEQTDRQITSSRDLELELELVRRVEPHSATEIETKIEGALASHAH